jgi:hypothetical protein
MTVQGRHGRHAAEYRQPFFRRLHGCIFPAYGGAVMPNQVTCPHCQAALRSQQPLRVGKAIRCVRCRGKFIVKQPDPDTLISVPYQAPPRASSRLSMWLALGGLLVLLGGGAGLAVYCLTLPEDPEDAESKESAALQELEHEGKLHPAKTKGGKKAGKVGETTGIAADPLDSAKNPDNNQSAKAGGAKASATKPKAATAKKNPPAKFKEPPWVAESVKNGIAFLRKHVQGDGKWSAAPNPTGYAALTGLTLLECGATARDPLVLAARQDVLANTALLPMTYEIALVILFLDRLGLKQDEGLIRQLALRLVAGQKADGGWTYGCPVLSGADHQEMLRFLQDNRLQLRELVRPQAFQMFIPGQQKPGPAAKAKPAKPPRPALTADKLSPGLRELPVVVQGKLEPPQPIAVGGRSDNSNSQFAMLALWVAQNHGVPMERTFNLVDQRFRNIQAEEGSWSYTPGESATRPAMTCAGLLGLAVGHGSAQQVAVRDVKLAADKEAAPSLQDAAIQKGLNYLGQNIGHPMPQPNPYLVWSVERVAVLYHLDTIGGKDWYTWGAKALLASQSEDGGWNLPAYPGANPTIDTCFALLFLKKANFVPGLTANLREYLRVRDPAENGTP